MAKAKKQSKSQSSKKSAAKSTQKSAQGASAKSASRSAGGRSQQSEQGVAQASMSKAREFVSSNANLPTAGLALAGAGVLALVSTAAGRNLVKAAAEAVISLVNLPAMTDSLPESLKAPFKADDKRANIGGKTDFAATSAAAGVKRGGKQNQKSTKAQI